MNYNSRYPTAKGGSRKLSKRPNETPGLENSIPLENQMYQAPFNPYNVPAENNVHPQYNNMPPQYNNMQPQFNNMEQFPPQYGQYPGFQANNANPGFMPNQFPMAGQFLSDPVIANMASSLVGTGKQMVDREIEKYVPVSKLKYYFAVNTSYVFKKLRLLFFPFNHTDWSVKYDQNEPVQPRYEVNAPDLYIPTMAYVTYVLVAGLVLGTQDRFSPEVLGILASSALAWTMLEIVVELVTLYVINISTHLKTLDLLAFAGYKYVGIIFAVLLSLVFNRSGYYAGLLYSSLALAFFLIRALKWQVLADVTAPVDDYNISVATSSSGNKRRLYFLLFVAGVQPFLMWWLSAHLVPPALAQPLPNL